MIQNEGTYLLLLLLLHRRCRDSCIAAAAGRCEPYASLQLSATYTAAAAAAAAGKAHRTSQPPP
jgi:hypothetical protein